MRDATHNEGSGSADTDADKRRDRDRRPDQRVPGNTACPRRVSSNLVDLGGEYILLAERTLANALTVGRWMSTVRRDVGPGLTIDEIITRREDTGVKVEDGESSEVEGDDLGSQRGEKGDEDGRGEHDGGGGAAV